MELYIIAGPNGAGKTTFAREFLPNYADCKNFVNADLIAQGIAPFSPETAALRAGQNNARGDPVICREATFLRFRNYALRPKSSDLVEKTQVRRI